MKTYVFNARIYITVDDEHEDEPAYAGCSYDPKHVSEDITIVEQDHEEEHYDGLLWVLDKIEPIGNLEFSDHEPVKEVWDDGEAFGWEKKRE